MPDPKPVVEFALFSAFDIRVGTVREATPFPEARKPAIKLQIDFGELGVLKSSAQLTRRYTPESLVGTQVLAIVNFPSRLIAGFRSECLVLGAADESGDVILLRPDQKTQDGWSVA